MNTSPAAPAVSFGEPLGLSIEDAARNLTVCRATVYNLINAGKLRTAKVGRRTVVLTSSVRALVGADLREAA